MRFKNLVRAGLGSMKSVSGGYGGTIGGGSFDRIGSTSGGKNWANEIGLGYDNSLFYAAIMFAWNALTEVDIYVRRPEGYDSQGNIKYKEIPNHPATEILKKPNPWMDGGTMIGGWVVSELAGPGYSCSYKHRSPAGKLIGLEYVPHWSIYPNCNPGSGNFIDYWQMSMVGGYKPVDPRNIVMQRYAPINPRRPQTCIGPLMALALEVATDIDAAVYTATILENNGVTANALSPGTSARDEDGTPYAWTGEQRDQIQDLINNKTTGDMRGSTVVFPRSIAVQSLGFDPKSLNLEAIRNIPEERICAALQIHPLSLYLGSALEQSNNRASAGSAFTQSARSFTKPYMRKKSAQLTEALIPEVGEPGEEICFRIDDIEALQEDKTETAKRDQLECQTYMTVNEKRAEKGLPPIEGGDVLVSRGSSKNSKSDDSDQDENKDR